MQKIQLVFTVAQLEAADLKNLQELYKEVKGSPAEAGIDKDALLYEILELAEPKEEDLTEEVSADSFSYDGKSYKVIIPQVEIPGLGIRTALEILVDEDAQAYLVKRNCIGSVIKEI